MLVVAVLAAVLVSAAIGGDDPPSPGALFGWVGGDASGNEEKTATPRATRSERASPPASTSEAPRSTATAEASELEVTGFAFPIDGACLPESDDLMPGAPREYRDGTHEGMDFYDFDNCATIGEGTEVLAAKEGVVIRADWAYEDLTDESLAELEERIANGEANDPDLLDVFRGRQVWIDHGSGVVTRYAHLSGIADTAELGRRVEAGELIAYVGDSGAPESVTDPGVELHLHFEIRVGDGYLGEGLPPEDVRALYEAAFASSP